MTMPTPRFDLLETKGLLRDGGPVLARLSVRMRVLLHNHDFLSHSARQSVRRGS